MESFLQTKIIAKIGHGLLTKKNHHISSKINKNSSLIEEIFG
jgi:hypothetical protein